MPAGGQFCAPCTSPATYPGRSRRRQTRPRRTAPSPGRQRMRGQRAAGHARRPLGIRRPPSSHRRPPCATPPAGKWARSRSLLCGKSAISFANVVWALSRAPRAIVRMGQEQQRLVGLPPPGPRGQRGFQALVASAHWLLLGQIGPESGNAPRPGDSRMYRVGHRRAEPRMPSAYFFSKPSATPNRTRHMSGIGMFCDTSRPTAGTASRPRQALRVAAGPRRQRTWRRRPARRRHRRRGRHRHAPRRGKITLGQRQIAGHIQGLRRDRVLGKLRGRRRVDRHGLAAPRRNLRPTRRPCPTRAAAACGPSPTTVNIFSTSVRARSGCFSFKRPRHQGPAGRRGRCRVLRPGELRPQRGK